MYEKKVLIDCSGIRVGGGIQVAVSFINDLNRLNTNLFFIVALSPQLNETIKKKEFNRNFEFIFFQPGYSSLFNRIKALKKIEKQFNPQVVFTLFGPSYYKSKVPKIVGFAIPHYIYLDSPYFQLITFKERLLHFVRRLLKVYLFIKFSNYLVFETENARNVFCKIYKFDTVKTLVAPNTINSLFDSPEKWNNRNFHFKQKTKILSLAANYKHKNLHIIPKTIDILESRYGLKDFCFVLSLKREDLNFDKRYDDYIQYIGKVNLEYLPSLYNQIDIAFIPSLLEVFSASFVEAMKMQVPIVASDLGFARDICNDSANYFQPNNAEDAAAKIFELIKNESPKVQLIKNGLDNLSRFGTSMDRTIKYLNLIEKVINSNIGNSK